MNKNRKGITLIALIVTIVVLLILAGITLYLIIGENGVIKQSNQAKEETSKQTAVEKMNFKIANIQINTYAKKQQMPTLQEVADEFCQDNEMEYVDLVSKKMATIEKIEVGEKRLLKK